jgi:hypothetical protein
MLNANSHAHLQKRLGRYQEYLTDVVRKLLLSCGISVRARAAEIDACDAYRGHCVAAGVDAMVEQCARGDIESRTNAWQAQVHAAASSECLRHFLLDETSGDEQPQAMPRSHAHDATQTPSAHPMASRPASAASTATTSQAALDVPPAAAAPRESCAALPLGRGRREGGGGGEGDAPAQDAHAAGARNSRKKLDSSLHGLEVEGSGDYGGSHSAASGVPPGGRAGSSGAASVEFLQSEVRRLERRVVQLERAQESWSQVLQQLMFNTLLDDSKAEGHRARLERKLQRAIAHKKDGKVSGVRVVRLRLPQDWQQVPELVLQSCVDHYSKWTVIWHPRTVSCDLSITGKRLGMSFSCSATLTMGLTGEFETRFVGGSAPSVTMSFLKDPQLQVQTSGTQVRRW